MPLQGVLALLPPSASPSPWEELDQDKVGGKRALHARPALPVCSAAELPLPGCCTDGLNSLGSRFSSFVQRQKGFEAPKLPQQERNQGFLGGVDVRFAPFTCSRRWWHTEFTRGDSLRVPTALVTSWSCGIVAQTCPAPPSRHSGGDTGSLLGSFSLIKGFITWRSHWGGKSRFWPAENPRRLFRELKVRLAISPT